jgi:hypothetical protein
MHPEIIKCKEKEEERKRLKFNPHTPKRFRLLFAKTRNVASAPYIQPTT